MHARGPLVHEPRGSWVMDVGLGPWGDRASVEKDLAVKKADQRRCLALRPWTCRALENGWMDGRGNTLDTSPSLARSRWCTPDRCSPPSRLIPSGGVDAAPALTLMTLLPLRNRLDVSRALASAAPWCTLMGGWVENALSFPVAESVWMLNDL